MKKLSIEEKARAYDRVSKEVKDFFEGRQKMYSDVSQTLEYLFPELRESEDERIRKELLAVINDLVLPDEQKYRFVAWLEKQGKLKEHNICDTCDEQYSCISPCPVKLLDKQGGQKTPEESLGVDSDTYNKTVDECIYGKQEPIDTVEPKFNVHDCIIKKHNSNINDFGYFTITDITGSKYWYNDRIICDISEQDEWELYEPVRQKPTWSEDDEKKRILLIRILEVNHPNDYFKVNPANTSNMEAMSTEELVSWLKSLKDRVQPQPKWSEEDEEHMCTISNILEDRKNQQTEVGIEILDKEITWIKHLKERVQPKQEWSEEDYKYYDKIGQYLVILLGRTTLPDEIESIDSCIEWLKSLKPQSTWKPSDEQMKALDSAIHCYAGISPTNNREVFALEIMKEQLQKLRGE